MCITKPAISICTWRSSVSAPPQGAFVVIPEISCSDISYIIKSFYQKMRSLSSAAPHFHFTIFSRYFDIACIRRLIGCVQTAIDSARPFVYDTGMHDERKPICAYEKYKDDSRYKYKVNGKHKNSKQCKTNVSCRSSVCTGQQLCLSA